MAAAMPPAPALRWMSPSPAVSAGPATGCSTMAPGPVGDCRATTLAPGAAATVTASKVMSPV